MSPNDIQSTKSPNDLKLFWGFRMQAFLGLLGLLPEDYLEEIPRELATRDRLRVLGIVWPQELDRLVSLETNKTFLVDGFIPTSNIAFTGGDSGIGKSPLLMQLALCVASGKPFMGMPISKTGPVLYYDLENSGEDSKVMRDTLCRFLGLLEPPRNFLLVNEPPKANVLHDQIAASHAVLVIFDSLRSYNPEAAKDNTTAGLWLMSLRKLIKQFKCTFLFNHHLRKRNKEYPMKLDADTTVLEWCEELEGGRALVNQTDIRIAIEGDPDGLKMKWNRRVHGDSPLYTIERVLDELGEPLGYRHLTGVDLLNPDQQTAFKKLALEFRFKDAKVAYGKTDNPTSIFLKRCKAYKLIEDYKSGYRKLSL